MLYVLRIYAALVAVPDFPRVHLNVLLLISVFYSYLTKALEMFSSAGRHTSRVTNMLFMALRSCIS